MNTPIAIKIECAKGEVMNTMQQIQDKYALPPCIMDGVISSVLAEVRSASKLELINAGNMMIQEKDAELEKAKAAAKKVLKADESGLGGEVAQVDDELESSGNAHKS